MSCCDDQKNHRPYRAEDRPGWAISCIKCGRTRLATAQEAAAAETAEADR